MKQQESLPLKMDLADRIQLVISYIIRFSLVLAVIFALVRGQWTTAFLSILALILTFAPAVIERNYRVYLPGEMEITMIVFVYASIYLGNIREYYVKFPWWDTALHSLSGVILGCVGFIIIYLLDAEKRISLQLKPKFIAFFSFTFAVCMGAIWEIFEFSIDTFLGGTMQQGSLRDTMMDLVCDASGALLTSFAGYFYIIKKKVFVVDRFIKRFVNQNAGRFHQTFHSEK